MSTMTFNETSSMTYSHITIDIIVEIKTQVVTLPDIQKNLSTEA